MGETNDTDKEAKVKTEAKKWSLEDEGSDEDENGVNGNDGGGQDDEVDPLDAYMSEVSKEVRKIKGGLNMKNAKALNRKVPKEEGNGDSTDQPPKKKGLVIMTGVAKKKPEVKSKKPEVMEQNQDGLEYS